MRKMQRRKLLRFGLVGLPVAALAAAAGCDSGVSQSEFDSVKSEMESEQQKASGLQTQLSDMQQELMAMEQEESNITVLTWAEPKDTPTPPPEPTPVPEGFVPEPKATVPPEISDEVLPFAFYVETLITAHISPFGLASSPNCVPSVVFKRGSRVVWRFEVFDTSTGKRTTDLDEAIVTIRMENGDEATARFGQRAGGRIPDAPWMWNATWDVPLDYKLGGVDYTIEVTLPDGTTGTWTQPALIAPDIGIDSRLQVVA